MHGHPAVPGRQRQTTGHGRRQRPPDQHQKPPNRAGLRRERLPLAPLLRHTESQRDRGAARRTDAPHHPQGRHDHADLRPPEGQRLQHRQRGRPRHAPHARHHARRRSGAFLVDDRKQRTPHDRPRTALPARGQHAASRGPQTAAHPHRGPALRRSQSDDLPSQQHCALQDPGAEVPPDGRQIPHAHRYGRFGRLHGLQLLRLRRRKGGSLLRQPRHHVPGHEPRASPLPRRRRQFHTAGIGFLQVPAVLRR